MRTTGRVRLLGTVGGLLALVLAGCQPAQAATHTNDDSKTYAGSMTVIELNLQAGDIKLSPRTGNVTVVKHRFHWRSLEPTIGENFVADTLVLTENCPSDSGCSVDFDVTVPAGVTVKAHTSSGDVTVTDLTGPLDLSSDSGDVTVHSAQSKATLSTLSGDITADQVQSTDVNASTQSGDVSLGFTAAPQTVTAQTGSGNVTLTLPTGGTYQVDAKTDSGQRTVTVAVDAASPRHISARTYSGDVTVRSS